MSSVPAFLLEETTVQWTIRRVSVINHYYSKEYSEGQHQTYRWFYLLNCLTEPDPLLLVIAQIFSICLYHYKSYPIVEEPHSGVSFEVKLVAE